MLGSFIPYYLLSAHFVLEADRMQGGWERMAENTKA